jgi:hypothetical protein
LDDGEHVDAEYLLHDTRLDFSVKSAPSQAPYVIVYALPGTHPAPPKITPEYRLYVEDQMAALVLTWEGAGTLTGLAPGKYTLIYAAVPAYTYISIHEMGEEFYERARVMQTEIELSEENSPLALEIDFPAE